MAVMSVETTRDVVSRELRTRVLGRLEQECLRLRAGARPALLRAIAAKGEGIDLVKVQRELAIVDYKIAAINDQLATTHDPHPGSALCANCCVLLDQGEGGRWFVLAALPVEGEEVIASDSALGRAMIGAREGESVHYPTPCGPRTARVIALEPS